jgi:phenylalanyl-tRNA synthetase beta chain
MKALWSWLTEYLDGDIDPEKAADRLNQAGLVVDAFERIRPTFEGVVVGRILTIERHPNADRLSYCTVDTGDGVKNIVCGATNIAVGQTVPVALVGARLKNGEFLIERRAIRGVESEGMMCSEAELDLGDDASGIMILENNFPLGAPLADVLELDDYILELEIPSNRPDCFGLIGIARELSALFGVPMRVPALSFEEGPERIESVASVRVEAPELCDRYSARAVVGCAPGGLSLFTIRRRLQLAGVRAISPIVDATNYVMLETSQPLHAFDLAKVPGGEIIVRRARDGETIVTLDGVTRELDHDILLIADREQATGIAGVMGGQISEVDESTTAVLIEGAHFNAASIMRTSRKLGLVTEASVRFEKNLDPEQTLYAVERCAMLIQEMTGGTVLRGAIDFRAGRHERRKVTLRHARLESVLGASFERERVRTILVGLGFEPVERDGEYEVSVPTHRPDVSREIDLIEEVARIAGYDTLPSTLPGNAGQGGYPERLRYMNSVKRTCLEQGFFEAVTYSLVPQTAYERLGLTPDGLSGTLVGRARRVVNPLSADFALLRTTLLYGLLESVRTNVTRGVRGARLFEVGRVFDDAGDLLPAEDTRLGVIATGPALEKTWGRDPIENSLFDIKGLLELVCSGVRGTVEIAGSVYPFFAAGAQGDIVIDGETCGFFGMVDGDIASSFDIRQPVFYGEISLDRLLSRGEIARSYTEIPVFPSIAYDVSFYVAESITFGAIETAIRSIAPRWLEELEVVDVFRGKSVPAGKKSMTLRLTFRSRERTLTDDETKPEFDRVIELLSSQFGAEIRGAGVE